ncbi:hypothetical protein B0H11DRAFT_2202889 [Mycena galericulata]|nr:hypothetical protein B0H11DRAFT_2202889 [Mycena galericulata]
MRFSESLFGCPSTRLPVFIMLDAYSAATAFAIRYALPSSSPCDKPRRNHASSPSYQYLHSPTFLPRPFLYYRSAVAVAGAPAIPQWDHAIFAARYSVPDKVRGSSAEADLRPRRLYRSFTAVALAIRSPTGRIQIPLLDDRYQDHSRFSIPGRADWRSNRSPCHPNKVASQNGYAAAHALELSNELLLTVCKIIDQSPRDIDAQYVLRSGPTP